MSLRISFGGQYKIDQFAQAMEQAIQTLRLNGIDGMAKIEVHLYPMSGHKFIHLHKPDDPRHVIDHLEYDAPISKEYRQVHHRLGPAPEDPPATSVKPAKKVTRRKK